MIRLSHILNEDAQKPSVDVINDAIAKIDKVAKQFGFKPRKKFNPTPGKRFKVHAQWIPKTTTEGGNPDSNVFLYTNSTGVGLGWVTNYNDYKLTKRGYDKPEEWFDIKKWKSVFGEKSEAMIKELASTFRGRTMDIHKLLTHSKSWEGFYSEFKKKFSSYPKDQKSIEDLKDIWSSYHPDEVPVVAESDAITGGKSSGMSIEDIAKKHGVSVKVLLDQWKKGVRTEMEHTDDPQIAKEIALDHLFEDPKYYDKLSKIEKK